MRPVKTPPWRLGECPEPGLVLQWFNFFMDKDLIPEAADGLVTVKRWASDVLYKLNPFQDDLQGVFLTTCTRRSS